MITREQTVTNQYKFFAAEITNCNFRICEMQGPRVLWRPNAYSAGAWQGNP